MTCFIITEYMGIDKLLPIPQLYITNSKEHIQTR